MLIQLQIGRASEFVIFVLGVSLAIANQSLAAPVLDPGDVFSFQSADDCTAGTAVPNIIEALGGASSSCDAADRRLTAQVRPISGPGFVGFQAIRAFAQLTNDFEVSVEPETDGNTVAAWISYSVDWDGRILLIGFLSKPSVEISIRLIDVTGGGKQIEGETIWARDDEAIGFSIPYVPVVDLNIGGGRDSNAVSSTFGAVLKRGHKYRIVLRLECAVFSDGGLDVGTECDYEDNFPIGNAGGGFGWSELSVKLGIDEVATLEELEKIREHTHLYLTGRGRGHNNTEAETGTALFPDGPPIDDMDGVMESVDLCLGTPEGFEVDMHGCAIEQFCALHDSSGDCSRADWQDDESTGARDCRWQNRTCSVR